MIVTSTGGWRFTLPRMLPSPNTLLWMSWQRKSRERREWSELLVATLLDTFGDRATLALLPKSSGIPGAHGQPCAERVRVTITRQVRSAGHFMRDRDNLAFSAKFLVDALTVLGFLKDDDEAWSERPLPRQEVNRDGPWTLVEIEPVTL